MENTSIFLDILRKQKKKTRLRYYEGRTQVDIAESLDISQMTVSRLEKKILNKFSIEFERMAE